MQFILFWQNRFDEEEEKQTSIIVTDLSNFKRHARKEVAVNDYDSKDGDLSSTELGHEMEQ